MIAAGLLDELGKVGGTIANAERATTRAIAPGTGRIRDRNQSDEDAGQGPDSVGRNPLQSVGGPSLANDDWRIRPW